MYRYMSTFDSDTTDYTRIVLEVQNPTNASFRLDYAPIARAIGRLLQPREETCFDEEEFDQAFTVLSEPSDFARAVLAESELESYLLHLRDGTEIELHGDALSLERIGLENDVEYLRFYLDLLAELAEAIERTGEPSAQEQQPCL
jgi:hypothetical protein